MAMDVRKVKKLIEMLEQSEISEIEVHEGEESVRISKHGSAVVAQPVAQHLVVGEGGQAAGTASAPAPAPDQERPGGAGGAADDLVKSPMVGIFYASSGPGSEPYVTAGSTVNKGDVLCIIEAMKVMNHIEAPRAGTVRNVLVDNGEPVEFGEPLFAISKD